MLKRKVQELQQSLAVAEVAQEKLKVRQTTTHPTHTNQSLTYKQDPPPSQLRSHQSPDRLSLPAAL